MLEKISTFLIDLDGVVYRGNEVISGAQEFIGWLEANSKKYLFLTNNSFATGPQILRKLEQMGIASDASHLMSAAQAAVQQIARQFPQGSVYVVGEEPLSDLVKEAGLSAVSQQTSKADAVLVGLDRNFNYLILTNAVLAILGGAAFIAINRDPLLPIVGGVVPGCGAMAAAIEAGTGITPEVIGKPEPVLLREAMIRLGSRPEETVMIGDGLDVDIQAGKAAGTSTVFVLSGRNSRQDIERLKIEPDATYTDLAAVLKDLKRLYA